MDNSEWSKIQDFISADMGSYVSEYVAEYIKNELTEEEQKPLGDIKAISDKMCQNPNTEIKNLVKGLIDLARKGVIIGPRKG